MREAGPRIVEVKLPVAVLPTVAPELPLSIPRTVEQAELPVAKTVRKVLVKRERVESVGISGRCGTRGRVNADVIETKAAHARCRVHSHVRRVRQRERVQRVVFAGQGKKQCLPSLMQPTGCSPKNVRCAADFRINF